MNAFKNYLKQISEGEGFDTHPEEDIKKMYDTRNQQGYEVYGKLSFLVEKMMNQASTIISSVPESVVDELYNYLDSEGGSLEEATDEIVKILLRYELNATSLGAKA